MDGPWTNWIPGVLNDTQIRQLYNGNYIVGRGALKKEHLDYSSIDLLISDEGYWIEAGYSVKPSGREPYNSLIEKEGSAIRLNPEPDGTFLLKCKQTYVFKIQERLGSDLWEAGFHGQATAKSSVGRIDVLARLVVDGMDQYEGFSPGRVKRANFFGDMYLEITPMTFNVKVKEGIALSQLRLFYGDPEISKVNSQESYRTILGEQAVDASLGVDLDQVEIRGEPVVAFCARRENTEPVPLWEEDKDENKPSPCDYWRFVTPDKPGRLRVEQDEFYLLRSKEKISVQKGVAVYCRASDETIGEMRIHYAGFAHPFFGKKRPDKPFGTPLIFEVRGHQVDVSLANGERMARLIFYRMSEDCEEKKTDNSITKQPKNPYQDQSLQLSKYFRDWPPKLERKSDDGIVEPA